MYPMLRHAPANGKEGSFHPWTTHCRTLYRLTRVPSGSSTSMVQRPWTLIPSVGPPLGEVLVPSMPPDVLARSLPIAGSAPWPSVPVVAYVPIVEMVASLPAPVPSSEPRGITAKMKTRTTVMVTPRPPTSVNNLLFVILATSRIRFAKC